MLLRISYNLWPYQLLMFLEYFVRFDFLLLFYKNVNEICECNRQIRRLEMFFKFAVPSKKILWCSRILISQFFMNPDILYIFRWPLTQAWFSSSNTTTSAGCSIVCAPSEKDVTWISPSVRSTRRRYVVFCLNIGWLSQLSVASSPNLILRLLLPSYVSYCILDYWWSRRKENLWLFWR